MLCANKQCTQGNFGKRKRFEPIRGEKVCSVECSIAVIQSKTFKRKHEKEIRINNAIEKKKVLEKLETHSDWLNKLEKVFNAYIRERDKGQPCISCGKKYGTFTNSAGHYYPAGNYSFLRFNEDNVHLQCWFNCNKNKHGNISEYTPRLINKIGIERFNYLVENRHNELKLTIPEIKELIEVYKQKRKSLLI